MTTAINIATFITQNKRRGEQLWVLSQEPAGNARREETIELLTSQCRASHKEIFGVEPQW